MNTDDVMTSLDLDAVGREIYDLIVELFPICRSITGNGLRQTLKILSKHIPLDIHEVPTGTKVFDWTVPKEWNIKDAYVRNSKGEKVIDFQKSNLHILNYSISAKVRLPLSELKKHLFTIPERPDWIPYRTSYYRETWGFCLSHNDFLKLEEGDYDVFIDSTLENGSLTYGELYSRGKEEEEILISCHTCHPSLANDNLSGVSLAVSLAQRIHAVEHRYSYRFLFIPGTIGAITWLALNEEKADKIKHGLVLTGVGDSGKITYKNSRRGNAEIDGAAAHVLKNSGEGFDILDFSPYGYDERQYCSPGFNLPVGCLSRTPHGKYPEYHTSGDNLRFMKKESLADSFRRVVDIFEILERNGRYLNLNPLCEPQLGKRGLYDEISSHRLAILWVLSFSDGAHSLLDISEKSGIPFQSLCEAADLLVKANLIARNDS